MEPDVSSNRSRVRVQWAELLLGKYTVPIFEASLLSLFQQQQGMTRTSADFSDLPIEC